ncbi:MAG: S9 family peptidase [Phycisphaeraceae bacterium]|nr:S9 family peptidase [Phycisphaeraceae bacterium]MCW5753801.1 S9 family peptidase [Phycisphaeraceae bacterium]
MLRSCIVGLMLTSVTCAAQQAVQAPLIPREVFFSNPDRASVQISPDGSTLSWLAPHGGVLNIWIAPVDRPEAARPITRDTGRGIQNYQWAWTSKHVLYLQDLGGDENWKLHAVSIEDGADRNLTPFEEILDDDGNPIMLPSGKPLRPTVRIEATSPRHPHHALIGLNNRDPRHHDLYKIDLRTGDLELIQLNHQFINYVADRDLKVRFAMQLAPDGGSIVLKADEHGGWVDGFTIPGDDINTTNILGFDEAGKLLYLTDSRGRDTAGFSVMDVHSGRLQLLAHDIRADITGAMFHPTKFYPQAVVSNPMRAEWQVIDLTIESDFKAVKSLSAGDASVTSRSADDRLWVAAVSRDDGPVRYYLYDRDKGSARFLFTNRSAIEDLPLAQMHGVVITSRDGLRLVSYLTLPPGISTRAAARPADPLPMVLLVHGGPWARDTWGYNPIHQWLANRGYAVLSVNFRGSVGFGKNFINAGDHEWAGKMHDDLIDAVNWAVKEGIADSARIGIMGGSYGGYATLVGLTFTPEVFACGVDIVGPSNLNTLLATIPPHWKPLMDYWAKRVGDPRTEEGRAMLEERSPLNRVEAIVRPLLIGQGANDPRVKQSESDQIVQRMMERGIPVTYVLFPDEGHGFARPENRRAFFAVTELFLGEHLGGRTEPFSDDFVDSTITVPEGATEIPGLTEALSTIPPR